MAGMPQIREAGWFITDRETDPVRHLFVRLEERMDGSGAWTVELRRCRTRPGIPSVVKQEYGNESDARAALTLIYELSRYLHDLPTWEPATTETGRWRIRATQPTEQDLQFRRKHEGANGTPDTRHSRPEG